MKDKWQRLKNWFMNKHNLHMIIGGFFLGVVLAVLIRLCQVGGLLFCISTSGMHLSPK